MSGTTTTQNVYQSNIPPFLEPYYKEILENSRNAFAPGTYVPYADANGNPIPRLAGFTPLQEEAFGATHALDSFYRPSFDRASSASEQIGAIGRAANQGDYYDPRDYENMAFTQDQYDAWMNPYIDNVLNRAQERATNRFDEQQVLRDQQNSRTGAFGGSRRFVTDAIAQRDLNDQLADLEATQLSNAYTNAQQQLVGQRQLGEASRQFDTGTRLKAADILGQQANLDLNIGTNRAKAELSNIDALLKTGGMQQQKQQAEYDLQYQDFLNQRDWSRNMLTQHSNLMRGIPTVTTGSTTTNNQGQPSTMNQIAGAAVASYPLWRGLFS